MFFIKDEIKVRSVVNSCNTEDELESCLEWIKHLSRRMNRHQLSELNNAVMLRWTAIEIERVNNQK